jgi:hypothetical protein
MMRKETADLLESEMRFNEAGNETSSSALGEVYINRRRELGGTQRASTTRSV